MAARFVGVRDLLFPSSPALTGSLRAGARLAARAFVQECRAIARMVETAEPEQREFVAGEVACVLHVSPHTATGKVNDALLLMAHPRLVAALEAGRLGVPHAQAVLSEISHLPAPDAAMVLHEVLGEGEDAVELTPGELRTAVKKAAIALDADAARKRHEQARKDRTGARMRPQVDGMAQLAVDAPAVEVATALAAINARAAAMSFDDDLTVGQRQVAALLHALGCERTSVQAVLECPVERHVDLHALAGAGVWTVDVRMPVAVALGLCDHPAILAGYGPIDADQARALLPQADLVKACVDAVTGEVLAVERPVRPRTWQSGNPDAARALREVLVRMATSGGTIADLTTDGYVPSEALGRLVDLRDVTSTFPGDAASARRCDRDHRLPHPLGATAAWNLQNLSRRWHRAKHHGWDSVLESDGTIRWTSPTRGVYRRRPKRTVPPKIPPGKTLPPLHDEV